MIRAKLDMPFLKVGVHLFVGTKLEINVATKQSVFRDVPSLGENEFAGRALYRGADFAVQILRNAVEHGVIAHEVFHVTHRIWSYLGDTFSVDHNEPYAHLCEYLTEWVYKQLKKGKVRVV